MVVSVIDVSVSTVVVGDVIVEVSSMNEVTTEASAARVVEAVTVITL